MGGSEFLICIAVHPFRPNTQRSMAEKVYPPPSKLKAKIWAHFGFYRAVEGRELDMNFAVCRLCKCKVKYCSNTTNLHLHFSRHHPEQQMLTAGAMQATSGNSVLCQPKMSDALKFKYPSTSARAQKITEALLCFICKDLRPYSVVDNEGFRQLMNECEPRYVIPTRRFITETAVPKLYKDMKEKVKETISSAERVAITCDAWTSRATQSYVTFTCHLISPEWEIVSVVLQTRAMFISHTGSNIADLLHSVIDGWGLGDKDPALVTDNASNMTIAAELAKLVHVKCFAHSLNLAAQRALKVPTMARLLRRIRSIVAFFRKSTAASHVLKEKQRLLNLPEHKLMTDVATRWNSAHDMLEWFIEQQAAICAALLSAEVRKNAKDLWTLNDEDLSCAENVAKALKPLKVATHVMSEEKTPTLSIIAPLHAQLCQSAEILATDSAATKEIKNAVSVDLGKRYVSDKPFLCMASALDPRFKALPFLEETERQETYTSMAAEAVRIYQVRMC